MRYNVDGFGEKLRRARTEAGMTQPQVAELFGVSYQTVSQWETGYSHPLIKNAMDLAEHFGFEIELIYEDGDDIKTVIANETLKVCPYPEDCCMKFKGRCKALNDVKFTGKCRFRKTRPDGPNLYDRRDKAIEGKIKPVYCAECIHRIELYTGDICEYTHFTVKPHDYCSLGKRRGAK